MYKKLKEPKIKKNRILNKLDSKKEKDKKIKMIKKLKINPLLKWIYIRDIK